MSSMPTAESSQETVSTQIEQDSTAQAAEPAEPPSEWELLRSRLQDSPHDPESWYRLIDLAESSGDAEKIKIAYDSLLDTYPNTSAAQIVYINHFLNPDGFLYAQQLFTRFLGKSPDVDLWKSYLTYVRRMNTSPATRDEVQKAYEFALKAVGQDKDSGEIWSDYIQFIRSRETTTTWEEQQKMDALRKVYHRAVPIPLENIDRLWSELEAFEISLNKITAKKFMAELSPAHMQAKSVLRQLQKHLGLLFPPAPPSHSNRPALYLPSPPSFNAAERALVGQWKNYLKWEESNPLEFDEKEKSTFITRVQLVYRKAVIRMRFFAEIWYMAYVWTKSVGKQEDAVSLLKTGIDAIPSSFLLNFAYAEELEAAKEPEKVHNIFAKFLEILRGQLEALESRISSANSSFSSNISTNPQHLNGNGTTTDGTVVKTEPGAESNNSSFSTQNSDEKPPKSKELADRRTEYGLVWIMYMRFARRAEGQRGLRLTFGRARKDRWTPWEVYEAGALMEYHCQKDIPVASRIFEVGLKTFEEEVEYVLRYLGFLISINDENNARALFERIIGNFPPDKARPLWERWARYVYQFGELEAAQKLEKRIAEVYPSDPPIKRFAQRHTYLGTDAIAARDLGFAMARQAATGGTMSGNANPNALSRTDTIQSLLAATNANLSQASLPTPSSASTSYKRPSSPDHKRRDEGRPSDGPPAHKRARGSPPPRDRDRWDGPPPRRYGSPVWDRDRERGPPPRRIEREKEEEKTTVLPQILTWFIGQLPSPAAFNAYGEPAFRTDDLMQVFRNAIIPSASSRARSPPPPARPTRPPPDYGPYQGPGGSRGGRRY